MSVTSATKQKLDGLLSEFSEFENIMKEGTRQRREQDEQKLQALKVEMGQIEKTLNSEVKRRVEMNKSLQAWCEAQIFDFHSKLEVRVVEKVEVLQAQADALVCRISKLEDDFGIEKERIPREIEERGKVLTLQLETFQKMFEKERQSRLQREGVLSKRLTDHEHEVGEQFVIERTAREQK